MKDITCYTGGASGSDMLFEDLCEKEGFTIISYSFDNHRTESRHRKILTAKELEDVNPKVELVSKIIKRTAPFKRDYIIRFLQRDIYQALNSQIIFAIGTIDWSKNVPHGGTAWAVGMGILLNLPIFFFDQTDSSWYRYNNKIAWNSVDEFFIQKYLLENEITLFTGIGTRDLKENGKEAINKIINFLKG